MTDTTWKKLFIVCKLIILGLVLFLFAWFFYIYFFSEQKVTWQYDFSGEPDHIFKLGPWNRVSSILQDDLGYYQELKDKIAYFDADVPRFSKKISLDILLSSQGNGKLPVIELGAEMFEDKFVRKKASISTVRARSRNPLYTVSDDFHRAELLVKNIQTRFMINVINFTEIKPVKIYQIKITHEKPKIGWKAILNKVRIMP